MAQTHGSKKKIAEKKLRVETQFIVCWRNVGSLAFFPSQGFLELFYAFLCYYALLKRETVRKKGIIQQS